MAGDALEGERPPVFQWFFRDCSHASSATLTGGLIRNGGTTMSTDPTNAHELNHLLLRLRRLIQGIEGTALLLCDHQLAQATGSTSPLQGKQPAEATHAMLCLAINGRRCAETVERLVAGPTVH
ncbi:hypothetical protein [Stenotrophomonas cyclobalanopsidis]|uniref:hypothetical protein n=2 Tax=Stenotrophomonas TaxID=40323 RepID=UPI002FD8BA8C